MNSNRGDITPRMTVTAAKVGTPRSTFRDSASSRRGPRSRGRPASAKVNKLQLPKTQTTSRTRQQQRRPLSSARRSQGMMEGSLTARSKNTGMFPGSSAKLSSSKAKPTKVRRDRQDFSGGQVGPPKTFARRTRKSKPTQFQRFYVRGDIPVTISHGAKRKLAWKVDIGKLDYHHYLPLFFEGLREVEEPYKFIAFQGCTELLLRGGNKVLPGMFWLVGWLLFGCCLVVWLLFGCLVVWLVGWLFGWLVVCWLLCSLILYSHHTRGN